MMQSALLEPEDLKRDRQPGDALVLWLPVFMCLGIAAYFSLSFEPAKSIGICLTLLAVLGVTATARWRETYAWRWAAGFFVLTSLGFMLAQFRTHAVHTHFVPHRFFNADVTGTIKDIERMGGGWRILFSNAKIEDDPQPYTLRLSVRRVHPDPQIGGTMHVRATIMPPSPPLLPGMYDFQRHAYFQKIGGYGYASRVLEVTQPEKIENETLLTRYRQFLADRVYANLKQPEAGITTALLNGQRGGIARKTTQNLQQSGLQHIISISGLHVGLMAGIVFFLTRFLMACNMRLALTWPIKKIAAACALVAIILYMMVVGDDPATLRSVIMTSIVLFAIIVDREAINLRLVAIAALAILLIHPESVLDIGFQLSFLAVASLVAFFQHTQSFWLHPGWQDNVLLKILRPLVMTVVTTIVVTLATAPLVLLHFQQIPLLSMVSNALATPVTAFIIMPGTFFSYLLTPFPVVGDWAIHFMGFGVTLLLRISNFVAHLTLSVWRMPAIPFSGVLLIIFGLLLIISFSSRWRWAGIAPVMIGMAVCLSYTPPDLMLARGGIVLLRDTKTLYAEGRLDSFNKSLFQQFNGAKNVKPFACENDPCLVDHKNTKIILVRTVPALKKACRTKGDLVITRFYLDRTCRDKPVVDRHKLEDEGGVLIWLDPFRSETAGDMEALRPWQQKIVAKQRWYSRKDRTRIGPSFTDRAYDDRSERRR